MIFVLLPLMVLSGLSLSPAMAAAAPWLFDLFGGRPTARSIHFITANLIVLFVIVHVVEAFLAGVFNEVGSMITGRYAVRPGPRMGSQTWDRTRRSLPAAGHRADPEAGG